MPGVWEQAPTRFGRFELVHQPGNLVESIRLLPERSHHRFEESVPLRDGPTVILWRLVARLHIDCFFKVVCSDLTQE
jgi:hypothetical protein